MMKLLVLALAFSFVTAAPLPNAKLAQGVSLKAKFDDFVERAIEAAEISNPLPQRYKQEVKTLMRALQHDYTGIEDLFDDFMDQLDAAPLPSLRNYVCTLVIQAGFFANKCGGGNMQFLTPSPPVG